jgi:hypothetical protein
MNEDDLRLALTGALPLALLVASALAVPLSFLALRRYRAAVVAGMQVSASAGSAPGKADEEDAEGPPPAASLVILDVEREGTAPMRARVGPWRLAGLYAVAGCAYAAVMSAGAVFADDQIQGTAAQLAPLALGYLWPAVMVVLFVAAYDQRRRLQVLGIYATAWMALMAVLATGSTGAGAFSLVATFLWLNVVPTLLVLGFSVRRIRAVGLLILSVLFLLALGAQTVMWFTATSEGFLWAVVGVGHALGLSAKAIVAALLALGFGVGALLAGPMARVIARRYDERRFSDQSLIADAHFLVFGVVQSLGPATASPPWFAVGLVAFAAYKLAMQLGLRALPAAPRPPSALLLLRVFRLGARSERLFDRLRRHWLHEGPVQMIAGPDLVGSTVEPHEFLDFLGGRLDRRFVRDASDLNERLARQRRGTDPDGRHRIEAFFCRADTWRGTMQQLAQRCDVVLMDLRSFAPDNQGCLYEIGQLLDIVDLRRVVFIVDSSTRRPFLEAALRDAWQHLGPGSPNRASARSSARLFTVERPDEQALLRLCAAVTVRDAPEQVVPGSA